MKHFKKSLACLLFIILPALSYGQTGLANKGYFSTFLNQHNKSVVMVGENHSASAAATIYPELVKYLNKNNDVHQLLIEFGPSEAYFYQLYLKTGNEKWLGYTIYGASYKDWKRAWRKVYAYNKSLEEPLKVSGIDFDRGRTLGYALYKMFSGYDTRPSYIDSLMTQVKDTTFFNTHTMGYPTKKDKQFVRSTRALLKRHQAEIKELLKAEDYRFVHQIAENNAMDYNDKREKKIAKNMQRIILHEKEDDFLLVIGRSHAYRDPIYDDKPRVVSLVDGKKGINILSGVILYQNSKLWGQDYKNPITLHEIKNKKPWKAYHSAINKEATSEFTIIPLSGKLKPLKSYTDYIIVARDQAPLEIVR